LSVASFDQCCDFPPSIQAFAENAKGLYTKSIFHNPLLTSRTPTEFWGTKWNLMIHRILKHGVYLPVRKVCPVRWVAVTATFVMSGLLHEYCWSLIFYRPATAGEDCPTCYTPIPLKLTLFFLWCGVVMLLERPVKPYLTFAKALPTPLVATIQLVLLALPISHWFTGDWAVGGMFSDFALALWTIKPV
jgi:Membrane bound O-acyl transferase family